ncbi:MULTISPECIES: hypothetical protein [Paenibacillus]|nr:hypothetical protein [Paenibacillus illinoisensis]MCM3206889.1 hypothetical protein [Paenibacillus illinoisensis]
MQQLGTSLTNHDRAAQNSGTLSPHHGLYVLIQEALHPEQKKPAIRSDPA